MKKLYIFTLAVLTILGIFPIAAKAGDSGLSVGVDYASTYLWRGAYWYEGDGAFFPSISYENGGISIGGVVEYSEDQLGDKESAVTSLHAADGGVEYTYSIEGAADIGASFWYFYFYNEKSNSFCTGSVFATLTSVPLSPTLTYNHDYYIDKDVAVEQKKDYYIQFGLSHDFELTKEAVLSTGVVAGYYSVKSFESELSGISDVDFSAALEVSLNDVSYSGSIHYVLVPGKDFYGDPKDMHRFYAGFGASYSF